MGVAFSLKKSFSIETDTWYYDLRVFIADVETNLNPNDDAINLQYFSDGLHPNAAGHAVIGRALAQFIEENMLI